MLRRDLPPLSRQVTSQEVHFFPPGGREGRDFRVAAVGRELCGADYVIEREGFVGYGIEFVLAGSGQAELDGAAHRLFPGAIFCYGPRTRHRIAGDSDAPMLKYFIDVAGAQAAGVLQHAGLGAGCSSSTCDPEGFRRLLDQMLSEAESGGPRSSEIAAAYARLLLLKVGGAARLSATAGSLVADSVAKTQRFIDAGHRTLRGLAEIAAGLHIEPAYLCRIFKKHAGVSPGRYLLSKKLQTAARDLAQTRLPVKEVAAGAGFEDPLYFSKAFKRHFGVSPKAFRELPRNAG